MSISDEALIKLVETAKAENRFNCPWQNDAWPVPSMARSGDAHRRVIYFYSDDKRAEGSMPFHEPFALFARSVVSLLRARYIEEVTFSPYQYTIAALRSLYAELPLELGESLRFTWETFDAAAAKACERPGTAALNVLSKLEFIADIVFNHRLCSWREPWRKDKRKHAVELKQQKIEDRIPTNRELAALAEISCSKDLCHLDAVRQCAIDLLLSCGFRVNEVITLPVDALYEELITDDTGELVSDEDGRPKRRYGLRYWPEKGGSGHVVLKAIPTVMVPVVIRALDRAKRLTQAARTVARHQYYNPGSTLLGEPWDSLSLDTELGPEEIAAALQLQGGARNALGQGFIRSNHIKHTVRDVIVKGRTYTRLFVRKNDLLKKLYDISFSHNCCPKEPVTVPLHECLFVMRWHNKRTHPGINGTVQPLRDHSLSQHIAPGVKSNTVFAETGLDGEIPMSMTTHDFRNLLNVLAIDGGLSQVELAHWMGRRDPRSNAAYDRRSLEDRADRLRGPMTAGGAISPPNAIRHDPLRADEVLAADGAGHVTEAGACERDLAGPSCQYHAARNDLVSRPRGLTALERGEVDRLLSETGRLRAAAVRERDDGSAGASEWVEAHGRTLSGLGAMDEPGTEDRP